MAKTAEVKMTHEALNKALVKFLNSKGMTTHVKAAEVIKLLEQKPFDVLDVTINVIDCEDCK